jgi:hypothetical protein
MGEVQEVRLTPVSNNVHGVSIFMYHMPYTKAERRSQRSDSGVPEALFIIALGPSHEFPGWKGHAITTRFVISSTICSPSWMLLLIIVHTNGQDASPRYSKGGDILEISCTRPQEW